MLVRPRNVLSLSLSLWFDSRSSLTRNESAKYDFFPRICMWLWPVVNDINFDDSNLCASQTIRWKSLCRFAVKGHRTIPARDNLCEEQNSQINDKLMLARCHKSPAPTAKPQFLFYNKRTPKKKAKRLNYSGEQFKSFRGEKNELKLSKKSEKMKRKSDRGRILLWHRHRSRPLKVNDDTTATKDKIICFCTQTK